MCRGTRRAEWENDRESNRGIVPVGRETSSSTWLASVGLKSPMEAGEAAGVWQGR